MESLQREETGRAPYRNGGGSSTYTHPAGSASVIVQNAAVMANQAASSPVPSSG